MSAERSVVGTKAELLQALVASAPVGAAVLDNDLRYVWVNQALCEMHDGERDEHLGRTPRAVVGRTGARIEAELQRVLRDGVPVPSYRFRSGKGAAVAHWLASFHPLHDDDGEIVGVGMLVSDITTYERNVAREQHFLTGLVRVAQAVASQAPSQEVFSVVAHEAAGLLGLEGAVVASYERDGIAVEGWWGSVTDTVARAGTQFSARDTPLSELVRRTERSQRMFSERPDALGFRARVAAPIIVDGVLWGAIKAGNRSESAVLPGDAEERLAKFAELVGLAVSNAAEQRRLIEQALRDPLTGLLNRRAFRDRIRSETERARRQLGNFSLVLLDLDEFKQVNDTYGHDRGDVVLQEAARRLDGQIRAEDLLARIGGEEFAWLMPGVDCAAAWLAAERARESILATAFPGVGRVTLSAGVASFDGADDAETLFRQADRALYHAKTHGRNRCSRYNAAAAPEQPRQRQMEAERARAMLALRALARAIDAKDAATFQHSERVAQLTQALAQALGWTPEQTLAARDAARLHDVGKIALPEHLLLKHAPLDEEEYEQIKTHAALGCQIASEILSDEQASWILHHHERWDGAGYPDGLREDEIPEGAQLIAVADAWDAMTVARPYATPLTSAQALEECARNGGSQFAPRVVEALLDLHRRGQLPVTPDAVSPRETAVSAGRDS